MPDPCCGMSLQQGTKIIAIVDIILAVAIIALGGYFLLDILATPDKDFEKTKMSKGVYVAAAIIFIIGGIFSLLIAVILFMGSNERDLCKCRTWFNTTVVLMVFTALTLISEFVGNRDGKQIAAYVISLILRSYFCWVVSAFMTELKGLNVNVPVYY